MINITVITTSETDWPQEATLCGHQKLQWKQDSECWPNCTTVRITLWLCFEFCKMYFISHFSGVCDLDYYYHFATFSICLRRKLGWSQSPLNYLNIVQRLSFWYHHMLLTKALLLYWYYLYGNLYVLNHFI